MTSFKPGSCVVFNASYNVRLTLQSFVHHHKDTTHNFKAENILLVTSRTMFNNQYVNIVGVLLPHNKIISFYVLHSSAIENIVTKITK